MGVVAEPPAVDLVIVGAPRSGTNMLRDVLTRVPGFATWPCDEINYVWRHGNRDQLDDELSVEAATPSVRRYVRRSFSWVRKHRGSPVVVEKTCATSLRVPFVDALLPEARFVFIHRDGADAAASASQRWNADLDLPYLARKARFVPTVDLPHYARRYLRGRVGRRGPRSAPTWGPRFAGMDVAVAHRPLDEVCALQWQRCVEFSMDALAPLDPRRVHTVAYERFVSDPVVETQAILDFVGANRAANEALVHDVRASSIGNARRTWTDEQVDRITRLIARTESRRAHV